MATDVENLPSLTEERPIGFGRLKRKEDPRFIRGRGNYVDDVRLPGMLHGAVLRSPLAHARIVSIDTSKALAHPNVAKSNTTPLISNHKLHPKVIVASSANVFMLHQLDGLDVDSAFLNYNGRYDFSITLCKEH